MANTGEKDVSGGCLLSGFHLKAVTIYIGIEKVSYLMRWKNWPDEVEKLEKLHEPERVGLRPCEREQ